MKSWKRPPLDLKISQYVDCYWFLEKDDSDATLSNPRLNPDPAAHLILTQVDLPYSYTLKDNEQSGCGVHLLLPYTSTITLHHSEPFAIIGIKFRVGALYSFATEPTSHQINEVINNPANLSPQKPFFDALLNLGSQDKSEAICAELDRWLTPLFQKAQEDRHSQLVRAALPILGKVSIEVVADQLHCSRRTLERSFQRVTGLTLKQYCSMQTLERLLTHLYQLNDSPPDWSDIATQFGFSDQSHLIRSLKIAIDTTPGDYLKQRDLTIDVYGDFE